ncbi:MAG: class I SAM-dependent methyltransferase [Promethearchaeota archaeon]
MTRKNQHYSTPSPDVSLKFHTVSTSIRKHLYLFKTVNGVFSFKKLDLGTKVLIENMMIPNEPSILLDLGCGYGPIGIVLLKESPNSKVYFIDTNKLAIWCTKENININVPERKKDAIVLRGSYFEPLKNQTIKFDGIYMNPPLRKGRKEFLNLFDKLPRYLKPNGSFQFVIRRKMGAEYMYKFISSNNTDGEINVTCKRSGYWVFNYTLKNGGI